jgi:hypothetical protein
VFVVSFTGPRCQSLFVVSPGHLGPRTGFADPEEPDLAPQVLARAASAVPQRWSSSCTVSRSFKMVKRRRIIRSLWPHVHRSCRRAIQTARLQPPSPSRGHIRVYRETCAISDPRTGFLGKIPRFVGRGRIPLVRRARPASIGVAGARPCDLRRPYRRRGKRFVINPCGRERIRRPSSRTPARLNTG